MRRSTIALLLSNAIGLATSSTELGVTPKVICLGPGLQRRIEAVDSFFKLCVGVLWGHRLPPCFWMLLTGLTTLPRVPPPAPIPCGSPVPACPAGSRAYEECA